MARPRRDNGTAPAKARIMDAFSQMALQKPVQDITVSALCQAAGCNKTTFYYHFETFAQLVEKYFELLDAPDLLKRAFGNLLGSGAEALEEPDRSELLRRYDVLCTLAALNKAGIMADTIHRVLREHAGSALRLNEHPDAKQEMLVEFATGGFMALLAYRGRTGNAVSFNSLVDVFYTDIVPALVRAAAS